MHQPQVQYQQYDRRREQQFQSDVEMRAASGPWARSQAPMTTSNAHPQTQQRTVQYDHPYAASTPIATAADFYPSYEDPAAAQYSQQSLPLSSGVSHHHAKQDSYSVQQLPKPLPFLRQPKEAVTTEAAKPPPITFPDGGWKACSVVLGGTLAFVAGLGYTTSFSVFLTYYDRYTLRGTNVETIAWIGSIQLWGTFGMGIPAGLALDRYGPKPPMIIATLFITFGTMMASISTELWHFILSQGICTAIGLGFSFTVALSAPQQWFLRQRALVTGLVVSGTSFGGVFWPIMVNRLLNYNNVSLGWTLRAIGFIQLTCLIAATLLIDTRLPRRQTKGLPLKQFFGSPAMLCLMLGLLLLYFAVYVPNFYITPYAIRWGATRKAAFYYPSIINGVSFFGRFACGMLADRVLGHFNTTIIILLITSLLGFTWLAALSNAGIIVWCCFYGFFSGALQSLSTPCIVKLAPAPQFISTYIGIGVTIISFGALFSEPIAGRLYDTAGTLFYIPMQVYVGAMIGAAAVPLAVARLLYNRKDFLKV